MNDLPHILEDYLKSGDDADFEKIVTAYGNLVFGVAMRGTGNRSLSEDIVQEVFIILARKASSIRETRKLPGWLHRTTVNCAANAGRKEATRRKAMKIFSEESLQNESSPSEEAATWKLSLPVLDKALNRLSANDREVVLLRFYQKASYRQISQRIGKSEEACRKKIARALAKLELHLKKEGVVVSSSTLGIGLNSDLAGNHLTTAVTKVTQLSTTTASVSNDSLLTLLTIMSKSKITVAAIAILSVMTGVGTCLSQHQKTSQLEKESALLRQEIEHENKRRVLVTSQLETQEKPTEINVPEESEATLSRDWKILGESMFEAERVQDFVAMMEITEELKEISAQEALQGLSDLQQLEMGDGPLRVLKRYLYKTAIPDYPEETLNYFVTEYESDQNDDFSMIAQGFKLWADKDLGLAHQWLDFRIEAGVFQSRSLDETHEGLAMLEAQLLNGLLESNPEALGERLKEMPPTQVMLILKQRGRIPFKSGLKEDMVKIIRQVLPKQEQEEALKLISE